MSRGFGYRYVRRRERRTVQPASEPGQPTVNAALLLRLGRQLARLRKREHWTHAQLQAHQERSLAALRAHAYQHSPFYKRFHRGLTDRPLDELPVLTKAELMEHFDELVTDRSVRLDAVRAHMAEGNPERLFLGRYRICATSGSTGLPGLFLFNRAEWLAVLASYARSLEWAGGRVRLTRRMRLALVASTNAWHLSAQVGRTLRSWWVPALHLDAALPPATIVQRLNAFRPELLVAYAAMAPILADEQAAGRLHIAPLHILTSSEVLTPEARRRTERAWGQRPFDQYGMTESGNLAAECQRHAGMHLMEDLALVEVVDVHNRPVQPGNYGEKVLVTVFASRTQPLIRYEVSDSLRLAASPCPCGRPFRLVDGIQGRMEDELRFPAQRGGDLIVHPNTFHHLLDTVPASGWQVVQELDGGLAVLLSGAAAGVDDRVVADAVLSALAARGAAPTTVRVQRVRAIPKSAAGKVRLILSQRRDPQVSASEAQGR